MTIENSLQGHEGMCVSQPNLIPTGNGPRQGVSKVFRFSLVMTVQGWFGEMASPRGVFPEWQGRFIYFSTAVLPQNSSLNATLYWLSTGKKNTPPYTRRRCAAACLPRALSVTCLAVCPAFQVCSCENRSRTGLRPGKRGNEAHRRICRDGSLSACCGLRTLH
jgi:hypothetical protein